ncbi:MAG: IclR family transcriptional regulator [Desulfovibrionaceae bacterium]|nr:IclR family transcriptional regulator [Desulfovibrionaceae bacterium]
MSGTTGTQSLRRGLHLLRWLGATREEDVRLPDLIEASGLERSTAYRLVAALVEEGFAERDPVTKRYRLGLEAMHIGLVAIDRTPLVERCRMPMRRLARVSGDTVFLTVRHGDYALCLHREEGSFPIKALTTNVGQRRLLGIGAAGRAILAQVSEAELDGVWRRHCAEFEALGMNCAGLRADMREIRTLGYAAMQDTITTGVSGIGCVFRPSAAILAGISIAAITSRMDLARRQELGELIALECAQLGLRSDYPKPAKPEPNKTYDASSRIGSDHGCDGVD